MHTFLACCYDFSGAERLNSFTEGSSRHPVSGFFLPELHTPPASKQVLSVLGLWAMAWPEKRQACASLDETEAPRLLVASSVPHIFSALLASCVSLEQTCT